MNHQKSQPPRVIPAAPRPRERFLVHYTPSCDACGRAMTTAGDVDQVLCARCRVTR
jgi:tRNA(Ile2) C34 agmatinyltransferase TiaS